MNRLLFLVLFVSLSTKVAAQQDGGKEDTIKLIRIDIEARFPGGEKAWREFLVKNLDPGVAVKNGAPPGMYTVIVKFVVNIDGSIDSLNAETNHGFGMEREVLRTLAKAGKWQPAMQGNKVVRAYRRQPVTFIVSEEGRRKRRS